MKIAALVGPTAAGKTGVAIELARRWGAEIVGVDASQVYRGMNVGTGKATPAELGGVRHHLLDVVSPGDPFDVGRYVEMADSALNEIKGRGGRALLCGGTGLYLRALIDGLCPAPPLTEDVRSSLRSRLAAGEGEAVHQELLAVDPVAAQRISPNDAQRLERALGVWHSTGKPLSTWQAEHGFGEKRYQARLAGIRWPRAVLNERIEVRVEQMFTMGWLEEVHGLIAAGHGPHLQSMGALGYRFIAAHLAGELSFKDAQEKTKIATRRYAKRQMTWFSRTKGVHWFDGPVDIEAVDAYFADFWDNGQTAK